MRRGVLFLLCTLALLCAAWVSAWAAPTIRRYNVMHTTLLRSYLPGGEPIPRWNRTVGLCMRDSAGLGNIASVTVLDPAGQPIPGEARWTSDPGWCSACICIEGEVSSLPPDGSYTLKAYGRDGTESAPLVTVPFHLPHPVPEITHPAPGSVIPETVPLFEWLSYPGFACEGGASAESQYVDLSTPDETVWLWGQDVPVSATSVLYGGPPLEPGHDYTAHLWERRARVVVDLQPCGCCYTEGTRRDSTFSVGWFTLHDFETEDELNASWGVAERSLSSEYASSGSSSMRITFPPSEAGTAWLFNCLSGQDWSAYTTLMMDFYNPSPTPLPIAIQLRDGQCGVDDNGFTWRRVVLQPGASTVSFYLGALPRIDGLGYLNPAHIYALVIDCQDTLTEPATIYWDNLRLFAHVPTPIEGTLLISGWGSEQWTGGPAYYLQGNADNITMPTPFDQGDISPTGDQVVYTYWIDVPSVLRAPLAGGDSTNLSAAAGLAGYNCGPRWSPDRSRIAFVHSDPLPDQPPCEAFRVWVMDADGRNAHQFSPEELGHSEGPNWSPDGRTISFWSAAEGCKAMNLDGSGLRCSPNGAWRPDGTAVVASFACETTMGDQPGVMQRLCEIPVGGGDSRLMFRRLVTYADLNAFAERTGTNVSDALWWLGPYNPRWSPSGESLVFAAAIPFDPDGPGDSLQDEAWLFTPADSNLTKVRSTPGFSDRSFSWWAPDTQRCPNTPVSSPAKMPVSVPICDVTTTFANVRGAGVTTSVVVTPPAPPAGYSWIGDAYHIATTATVQGAVTVAIRYNRLLVPGGKDGRLALLHLVNGKWVDVTNQIDPKKSAITGACPLPSASGGTIDLSVFAVAYKTK